MYSLQPTKKGYFEMYQMLHVESIYSSSFPDMMRCNPEMQVCNKRKQSYHFWRPQLVPLILDPALDLIQITILKV